MTTREVPIPIERVFEVLLSYAASDVQLRLHIENAQRQTLAEVQTVRIDELEDEIRRRLDEESVQAEDVVPELAAVEDDEPNEVDEGSS